MGIYVVTGGYGFIGQSLVSQLQTAGHSVVVASRTVNRNANVDWVEFDLKERETAGNIANMQPDVVFHLSWTTIPATAETDAASDISNNLSGTICLLENLAKAACAKVILVSSGGAVYGRTSANPVSESHPLNPIGIYGMTKYAMELYALRCQLFGELDVRIARVSNPFGASQPSAKMQGAASIFARKIIRGETINIWGDGCVIRDYIDVEDAAAGLIAISSIDKSRLIDAPIFNVGSGRGFSLNNLIAHLEAAIDRKANVKYNALRNFDIPFNVLNIEKLTGKTRWNPRDVDGQLSAMIRALA